MSTDLLYQNNRKCRSSKDSDAAGRYEEAVAAFTKLKDPNVKTHLYLAASYGQLGQMKEARAEVEQVLKTHPGRSLQD